MAQEEGLFTTTTVAALLKVHPKQVYRLMKQGLPAHRMGGEWRFVKEEVLAWAEGRARPQAAPPVHPPSESLPPLLAANGDVVIELLLSSIEEKGENLLGFVLSDKGRALRYLQDGAVLFAGSHGEQIPARIDGERLARIHLVEREIGIASQSPIQRLRELEDKTLASRPETAGVYHHLMSAMQTEKMDAKKVQRGAKVYHSHRDVVCAVARGDAQLGLATQAWSARLGLSFYSIATESYGLLVKAKDLGDPRVVHLCEVAQSQSFHQKLQEISGYKVKNTGDIRYDQ